VLGGVSVRTRFLVFVAVCVGVDPGVGALEKGNESRCWWLLCGLASGEIAGRRRPLPIDMANALVGGADGAAEFSDGALGVAGGAFVSTGADMAAGKFGRQFPNIP